MNGSYDSKDGFHPGGDIVMAAGKKIKGASGGVTPNVPQVTTPNGSDATTTQALANDLKASHNDLLAKLKAAGIVSAD